MYDLFDTFFNPWYDDSEYNKKAPKQQAPQNTQNLMKTDIRELADGYELQMELPGYKKEEVQAAMWASISVRKISGQVSRTVFLPCLFQRKIRQRRKKRNILPLRNPL